jgi:TP901 family phage tail tape measure protein
MAKQSASGVPPIVMALKVDMDAANSKLAKELSKTAKSLQAGYSSIAGIATGAVFGAAIGAAGAMATALLFTVGAASKFEDSFAGIKKTVDASSAEFDKLQGSIRTLSTEIPIAASQLNQIGELGGQLGVESSGLPIFIETIAKLGVATRLSTETAALSLARLQTIFQLPETQVANLASSLVELGNNFAALEDEILSTSLRLAAGAKVAGATVADTLAIATALQAVGVQSQAGGTAMSRVFQAITVALQGGTKEMRTFAQVTGLGVEGFRQLATSDPAQALNAFLIGLQKAKDEGRNLISILEDLGLKQQRTIRALLSVAEAGDLLSETLAVANTEYVINNALNEEAAKRFDTLKQQTKLMKNAFTELRTEIGMQFLPVMKNIVNFFGATAVGMAETEKSIDQASTALKVFVGVATVAGGALGASLGQLISIQGLALKNGQGLFQTIRLLASGGVVKDATKGMTMFAKGLSGFLKVAGKALGPLALLGIAFGVNATMNRKAQQEVDRYSKSVQTLIPLQQQLVEKTNLYKELIQDKDNENIFRPNTAGAEALRNQIDLITAEIKKLENATATSFLNIAKGFRNLSLEEGQEVQDVFSNIAETFDGERGGQLIENFAKEFNISQQQAQKIISQGLLSTAQFITTAALSDEKAFDKAADVFRTYTTGIVMTNQELKKVNDELKTEQDIATQNIANQSVLLMDFVSRMDRLSGAETDMLRDSMKATLEAYNDIAGQVGSGLEKIPEIVFFTDPEAQIKVFKVLNGQIDEVADSTLAASQSSDDLVNKFNEALSPLREMKDLLEDIADPELISMDSIEGGVKKAQELEQVLELGVFRLLEEGYPALALSFAEGGIEAENLGKLITIMNSGIEENVGLLMTMEDGLIDSNEDLSYLTSLQADTLGKVTTELRQQYGLTQSTLSIKEQQALIDKVSLSRQKEIKNENKSMLSIAREIVNMAREERDARADIKEMNDDIAALSADLVYDNITITNAMRDQLEIETAKAELDKAIAEYGREDVVTKSEKLSLLQMELNITKMNDRLSQQMTAREKKSIRDKQKEIKFLQMAVEQGVAEQLDLDVAREELAELTKPMASVEKEILQIQKELAEAELEIAKERAKGLAPEIISAIENYNKALEVTSTRNDEVKQKQQELSDATTDLNFDLAENAERYDEIAAKFPNFKDEVLEIAGMVGIPDEMLTAALDSMDKSVTEFIDYVEYARKFRDSVISGEAGGADWTQSQEGMQSWKDSDAWRSMNTYKPGDRTKPSSLDPSIIPPSGPSEPDQPKMPWWERASRFIVDPSSRGVPKIDFAKEFNKINLDNSLGFTGFGGYPGQTPPNLPKYQSNDPSYIGLTDLAKEYILNPIGKAASSINWGQVLDIQNTYMGKAYGGNVPVGKSSIVGEMGPEIIMSTPGGTSVFANKTGGGYGGVTVENMNVNITGLPADPISARKAAINIRKELTKLEKEGNAGTGLRNR